MRLLLKFIIIMLLLVLLGCKSSSVLHYIEILSEENENYIIVIPQSYLTKQAKYDFNKEILARLNEIDNVIIPDNRILKKELGVDDDYFYSRFFFEDGEKKLTDVISPYSKGMLWYVLYKEKMPKEIWDSYRPWVIAMLELPKLLIEKEIYYYNNTIDIVAENFDKDKIIPLHTEIDIIDFFAGLSYAEQDTLLNNRLKNYVKLEQEEYDDNFKLLIAIQNGNYKKAEKIVDKMKKEGCFDYRLEKRFNAKFDDSFIAQAEIALKSELNSMIICDPIEAFGNDGLINHFRIKGYRIRYY